MWLTILYHVSSSAEMTELQASINNTLKQYFLSMGSQAVVPSKSAIWNNWGGRWKNNWTFLKLDVVSVIDHLTWFFYIQAKEREISSGLTNYLFHILASQDKTENKKEDWGRKLPVTFQWNGLWPDDLKFWWLSEIFCFIFIVEETYRV